MHSRYIVTHNHRYLGFSLILLFLNCLSHSLLLLTIIGSITECLSPPGKRSCLIRNSYLMLNKNQDNPKEVTEKILEMMKEAYEDFQGVEIIIPEF